MNRRKRYGEGPTKALAWVMGLLALACVVWLVALAINGTPAP